MNFLVPAFLAGLAALAIPIAMHLRHREKGTPVRFPSLMFLERLAIRTSKRQRITDWPLLALRALALALLVLAFARPFSTGTAAASTGPAERTLVVLLDRSLSMSHAQVWPAALDSARALVRTLGPNDRGALVLFDEEAEIAQPFTSDRSALEAVLASVRPGTRGTRYVSALRVARRVLVEAPGVPVEIAIITDLQRGGVAGLVGLELPSRATVRTVAVTASDRGNTSVGGVEVRRVADSDRTRLAVQTRILTRDLAEPRTLTARLELDGRASGEQRLTLPTDGERLVSFDAVPLPSGRVRGRVVLDADLLAADDTFHFALAGEDALPVTLVAPDEALRDETLFTERALAIGRAPTVRITRQRPGALARALPEGIGLALLWDTPLETAEMSAIESWVREGGGVVVVVGRRLAARGGLTPLGAATVTGTTDRFADRGGSFGDVRREHPLFTTFRETPSALTGARFLRYARAEVAGGADVLARFDDGLPAVLESRLGNGRVLTVLAPLDTRTGDLPLQPAFLPLMRRLVLHASGHAAAPLWQESGGTWALPRGIADVVVTTPSGDLIRPAANDSLGAAIPLTERGVYAAYSGSVSGDPVTTVAVNTPAVESDLSPVDARELLVGVAPEDSADVAFAGPAIGTEREKRQGWWRWLVAAAAVLLIGETFLANGGWRSRAARSTLMTGSGPLTASETSAP
jgi:hypothetical protein